jgi:uncharacterized protein YbjT (DUF2867 family)
MKILVTGATGHVGAHLVRALTERGQPPRAFVRDAEQAVRVLGPDADLAVGDFADRGSIARALDGIDRVFLGCGNVPGQVEFECAVIDEAAAVGVHRIVKLSGPRADVDSTLIFERWHGEIERHLRGSGVPSVVLRPRTYMTNLLAHAATIQQASQIFAAVGTAPISFVDPYDVAAVAAQVLVEAGHEGRIYEVSGPESLSHGQIAEELSIVLGRRIGYVDVHPEVARQAMLAEGVPESVTEFILGFFASVQTGSLAETTDVVRRLTGRDPRTFVQFARDHAAQFEGETADRAPLPAGAR